ncbi:MAG: isoprenylcysteine carboxylmethyltransferase family protein [Abditibacteriota bacterium]|nr:isoprenylcysteine carboxylmethyltransferase family protein [Abditibacteriota bacterium]MBP5718222.1 isoprenylcysteine carboxylmethyltransferase family protein [Abditibacteriota bacterium]
MGERELDFTPYRDGPIREGLRAVFTFLRMPLLFILFIYLVMFKMHSVAAYAVGAVIALAGEWGQVASASYILKNRHLTVSGPYAHVRNPMFISRYFVGLGIAVMTLDPVIIGIYTVCYIIYAADRVHREERILRGIFPENRVAAYMDAVPRWIPKLKRYRYTEARTPSWYWVKKNHEDVHLYGLIAVLLFIGYKVIFHPDVTAKIMALIGGFLGR